MKKPKNYDKIKPFNTYWVELDGEMYETRARSPEEANVRARNQAGLAGSYEWHEVETNSVEIAHTKIIDNREEIKC